MRKFTYWANALSGQWPGGRTSGRAEREDALHAASSGFDRLNGTGLRQRTSITVGRAIAVVAGGLGLAACSFAMPSMDFISSKPTTASLSIESNPPGADARLSIGGNCRTPCTQTVALGNEFTVTVSLNGYMPETRTVKPVSADASAGSSGAAALLDPNPLFVELKANAPPKPPPPKKKRKRPIQTAAPAADAPPPQTGFGTAPPAGGFTPTPGRIQ
jgi:hypothetical protein